ARPRHAQPPRTRRRAGLEDPDFVAETPTAVAASHISSASHSALRTGKGFGKLGRFPNSDKAEAQNTGVSRQTPHTSRSASHISPIVTYSFDASTISGIRFRSSCAAFSLSFASADSTAAESRRPRNA